VELVQLLSVWPPSLRHLLRARHLQDVQPHLPAGQLLQFPAKLLGRPVIITQHAKAHRKTILFCALASLRIPQLFHAFPKSGVALPFPPQSKTSLNIPWAPGQARLLKVAQY